MSKRVGLFVNGLDPKSELEAGESDVERLYSIMIADNKGQCCPVLSEKHLSIENEISFTIILMKFLEKIEPTDQIIFYFSGHGEVDGTKYYLKFGKDKYFFDTFNCALRGKNINKAIIILDACFSGEVAKNNQQLIINDIPEGIGIITSSTEEELSHENETKTMSVFTELLCNCIDTGNNNICTDTDLITISDVINYVRKYNTHYKQQQPKHKISNSIKEPWISQNITKNKSLPVYNDISVYERINYENCSFTEKLNDCASIDDLNWDLVIKYIEKREFVIDLNESKNNILSKLGFIKDSKLLNSVVINFAKRPDTFISQALIQVTIDKSNIERLYGSSPELLEKTVNYILSNLDKYSDFTKSYVREDDYVIPKILVRESISNALTHRCYDTSICNIPIKVNISKTNKQLEITSPGDFLGNYEEILKDESNDFSFLRDAKMGDFMITLGVAESLGRGFDFFREYIKENGKDFIQFNTNNTHSKIIIKFRELDNEVNFNQKNKVSPFLTNKLGMNSRFFMGRDKELKEVKKILSHSNLLLINGIGGIGKSSFVSKYLTINREEYNYFGYIVVEDNIKGNFIAKLRESLNLQETNSEETFNELLSKLARLDGLKLLVVDDIRNPEKQKKEIESLIDLQNYNFKLIFTSRTKIKGIENFSLETLRPEIAKELFFEYYNKSILINEDGRNDERLIDMILKFIDYHPLFLELITKTLNTENYTFNDILNKFYNGELSEIKFIDEDNGYEANLNDNLKELFSMQKLDKSYELLLKKLALLPSIEIDFTLIEKIINDKLLNGKLNFLVSRGWLIHNNQYYKMHQIIKEYIISNHKINFSEIEDIIDFFNSSFDEKIESYHQDDTMYFDSIFRVTNQMNMENEKIMKFYHFIGNIYNFVGKYTKAYQIFNVSSEMTKKFYGKNSKEYLFDLGDIALLSEKLGRYQESLEIHRKYIDILKEYHPDNKVNIAIQYANLANVLQQMDQIDIATKHQKMAIDILESELGEQSIEVSSCYNNMAMIFLKKRNFSDALKYLHKSLNISFAVEDKDESEIAKKYENLAYIYSSILKIEDAKKFIKKSFEIKEKLYDKIHPEIAVTYYIMALIYSKSKECFKAKYYAERSLEIFNLINFIHPYIEHVRILIKELNINIKKQEKANFKKSGKYCIDNKDFTLDLL